MTGFLQPYFRLPRSVYLIVLAQLALNLVNVGLFMIFNLYLRGLGCDDAFIAQIISYRFLGTLTLGLPLGLMLRGRRLKPLFLLAAAGLPVITWVMVELAASEARGYLWVAALAWGIFLLFMNVGTVPYIMRVASEDTRTEGIALCMSTFPLSMMACGLAVPALQRLGSIDIAGWSLVLDDGGCLQLFGIVSLAALPLVLCLREPAPTPQAPSQGPGWLDHDWGLILRAISPNLLIAIGAGLTIPYVNLFFNAVFDLDSRGFSRMGGITGVLVLVASLANTGLRRRFGYSATITLTQTLAVFFLLLLALTELLQHVPGMFWVAATCYILRQPLMNMAGPISTELMMSYAGERNRELVSALQQIIWSGSWFVSAKIFQALRAAELPYWQIFLITAALYSVGIVLYAMLIKDDARRRGGRCSGAGASDAR